MSNSVAIRRFEHDDAPACRSLWAELTEWHRELYDDPSIGGEDAGSGLDRYLEEFGDAPMWVAERDGSVVGFVGLIVRGNQGEVEPVVVSEELRRQGIGRLLVDVALDAARSRGLGQVKVRPVARNEQAIGFFHTLGFRAIGHVELLLDLKRPRSYWRSGERLAGRDFDL